MRSDHPNRNETARYANTDNREFEQLDNIYITIRRVFLIQIFQNNTRFSLNHQVHSQTYLKTRRLNF